MLGSDVSNVEELHRTLYNIALYKNELPIQLRGWVNALGLYVQSGLVFPGEEAREYLMAGGKFRKYLYVTCDYTLNDDKDSEIQASNLMGDFSHWRVKKFDQKVWRERFAHLVGPTVEISWFLARDLYVSKEKEQLLDKLGTAVRHFKSTGEWLGLHDNRCVSCGQRISWWNYMDFKPCPYCGGKIRD